MAYTINFIRVIPTDMPFRKGAIEFSSGVQIWIPDPYTTGMNGAVKLPRDQKVDLLENQFYFNLHSVTYSGGEIRDIWVIWLILVIKIKTLVK